MENKKWYPVNYAGFWTIQSDGYYGDETVLDSADVGEEQAEENAKLCASAPIMKQLLDDMQKLLEQSLNYIPIDEEKKSNMKIIDDIENILVAFEEFNNSAL